MIFTHSSRLNGYTVSPFDEKLAEDKRINRLEDSYLLWRSVCANKLLARTQLILCKLCNLSPHIRAHLFNPLTSPE